MAVTQYKFYPFTSGVSYKRFDVALDPTIPRYYYCTQDSSDHNPLAFYSYNVDSWYRKDEQTTVFFTKTGGGPDFKVGSLVIANNLSDSSVNYTGMVIDAGSNFVRYINGGFDTGFVGVVGSVSTVLSPVWTTGFFFQPSYSTSYDIKSRVINFQFGDGYNQRQKDGLNNNNYTVNLVFDGRSDRETRAILNFIQDKGGVSAFKTLMPVSSLNNDPELEYTCADSRVTSQSYNLNNITLTLVQSFDKIKPVISMGE
jgi:phage-related protein